MTPSCYAQCMSYVTDFAPSRDYIFGGCFKWCVCDIPTSHLDSGVNNFSDKNRNGTHSSSCTVWNTQDKYFFAFVWKLFCWHVFTPLHPSIPIVVGLVTEKSLLIANGQIQFSVYPETMRISFEWYLSLGVQDPWGTSFSLCCSFCKFLLTLHKPSCNYSGCSFVWQESNRQRCPVQPSRCWAWHRQEEELRQPFWYACLCSNKEDS